MKPLFFALLAFFSITASAQILNAESLRKVTDTSGFSGATSLRFSFKRNTNDFLAVTSNLHLQYKTKNHLFLFKNDIDFQKIEGERFENSGISHLRYNYRFHPRIAWEIFTQAQYNKISLITFRGLLGTGTRFKLSNADNYKFYLGTLIMYEHEEIDDGITPLQRDFRGSIYFSFSLYPKSNISITSTTYYQPLLSSFSDYRVANQSSLAIKLIENLAFLSSYTFTYDAFPAVGIPNSQYDFTSGLSYSFD